MQILVITTKNAVPDSVKAFVEFDKDKAEAYFVSQGKQFEGFVNEDAEFYLEDGYFEDDFNNSVVITWLPIPEAGHPTSNQ